MFNVSRFIAEVHIELTNSINVVNLEVSTEALQRAVVLRVANLVATTQHQNTILVAVIDSERIVLTNEGDLAVGRSNFCY